MNTCPACGTVADQRYTIADRFQSPLVIERCASCGMELLASAEQNPNELYGEDYYTGRAEYSYRDERERVRFDRHVWNARLKEIGRFVAPPADFLDVGCAFGGFVECAGEFGYKARGLDVSEFAVRDGRARGLDLIRGELKPGVLPEASVDVLTMIEVLEHLPDPVAAFQAMRDLVRPGGLVVIQTANFLGRQARRAGESYHYYLPGHLYYYSTHNLRLLLERFGFSRIKFFRPVEFGLLAKLKKSRGDFRKLSDYRRWWPTARYHWLSHLAWRDFAYTSSMVCYARRNRY